MLGLLRIKALAKTAVVERIERAAAKRVFVRFILGLSGLGKVCRGTTGTRQRLGKCKGAGGNDGIGKQGSRYDDRESGCEEVVLCNCHFEIPLNWVV